MVKERQKKNALMLLCIFFFLCIPVVQTVAQNDSKRVTLDLKSATIKEFFDAVKKQTGLSFIYDADLIGNVPKMSLHIVDQPITNVLDKVSPGMGCRYEIKGNIVTFISVRKLEKKTRMLTGSVSDQDGPLPGVNIYIKNSSSHAITDVDGNYSMPIPTKDCVVSYSYVGMEQQSLSIRKGEVNIKRNVRLKSSTAIDEVVVTGIFSKPKESFTGAATRMTGDELKAVGNRTSIQSIANLDPSFVIAENNSLGSDPNSLPEIRLRGVSTIPSVDEVQNSTRANLCTPLIIMDGFEITLQQLLDLTNDEIETITILKDASATAIYGSRGANGVVVVVGKKPKQGKLKVTYSGGCNLEIPSLSSYNLMNASEKLQLEYEAGLYNNERADMDYTLKQSYAYKLSRVMAGVDTDWVHMPVQTGIGSSHYINLGGGDNSFRYNLSLSYKNTRGAMKGSERDNVNGRANVAYQSKKFNFQNSISFGVNEAQDSPYGSFSNYVNMNPYWEPLDEKGHLVHYFETESNALFTSPVVNPYYTAMQADFSKNRYTNITNNSAITYRPSDSFQATVNFSFGKTFSETDKFVSPANVTNLYDDSKKGSRSYSNSTTSYWNANATLSYYKQWNDHILTVGANTEIRENTFRSQGMTVIGYVNGSMNSLNNGEDYDGHARSSNTVSRAVGLTATANYNFANRYYVDASYRLDGASSFGKDSRFAPFWSTGAGWTISNEKFIKDNFRFINSLRLRYSYGVSGSISFDPWQSQGTYQYGNGNTSYHGGTSATIRGMENKNLKWQTTDQHNAGFDLSIGFVSISGNWYRKVTNNAITDMSLPLTSGFESYTGNTGKILNTGTDLSISLRLINDSERQIFWTASFGTSHNTNKLLTLSDAVKRRMNESKNSTNLYYVYEEGNSVDAIYAVPTAGVDPATGKMVYRYKDGSLSYDYDVNQRVVCGDRMPKLDGRINTNFSWQGFHFNASFSIRSGGQVYNYTYANKIENVDFTKNVDKRVLTSRWKQPGDEALFVGYDSRKHYIIDRYVQDENTFSCNNLSVSYDFRQNWVTRLGLQYLSINGSISNVFRISTIREERGTTYPYAIQPSFGLSCSF